VDDDELLRAFEAGALAAGAFGHREHLRLAWLCVRRDGPARAEAAVARGLRRLAAAHGVPGRYHATLTRFWVRLIAHAAGAAPGLADFDAFLARYPLLLDRRLPARHYRPATLAGAAARARWVAPDLAPLPA
jgi:hypothetical protein